MILVAWIVGTGLVSLMAWKELNGLAGYFRDDFEYHHFFSEDSLRTEIQHPIGEVIDVQTS